MLEKYVCDTLYILKVNQVTRTAVVQWFRDCVSPNLCPKALRTIYTHAKQLMCNNIQPSVQNQFEVENFEIPRLPEMLQGGVFFCLAYLKHVERETRRHFLLELGCHCHHQIFDCRI